MDIHLQKLPFYIQIAIEICFLIHLHKNIYNQSLQCFVNQIGKEWFLVVLLICISDLWCICSVRSGMHLIWVPVIVCYCSFSPRPYLSAQYYLDMAFDSPLTPKKHIFQFSFLDHFLFYVFVFIFSNKLYREVFLEPAWFTLSSWLA